MDLSEETKKQLYHDMLRIRKVELKIESLYHLDEMKTPIHLCIGQEAVSVGACTWPPLKTTGEEFPLRLQFRQ